MPVLASASEATNAIVVPHAEELEALVSDVLRHNPELAFYQAEIAAAKGEARGASAWENPEVSTTLGQKKVNSGGISAEGISWSVSVKQTFEWPGRISLRKAIANRQKKLAETGLTQFRNSLAARARTLAYALFAAQEKSKAANEVAMRFRELREVLVQRDPAGLTPQLEMRIIEATDLTLQRKATEAAISAQSSLMELNQLRGEPWTNAIKLVPVDLQFAAMPDQSFLLAAAATNNFELQMRRAELEQQGFKVSLARKDGYPSVSVGPYYSEESAGDREQQVGVAISVPLPLWNRNKGNIEVAEARRIQAETLLLVAERDLDRRVLLASITDQAKRDEMDRWKPDSVDEFQKAAALADRHYRLGSVPIATYIELQKQYLEAVEALVDTRREALQSAQDVENLTGMELKTFTALNMEKPSHP